ncbi:MAG: bifunctional 2-polyprenyl-6-hydroxyphenol methylase/3-demethylubiquinol 3-O-methyltransferase UbiG, partial [Pseudomonadota bacterium]|nr:bifunctional 2-polyprenyl-6-hydroxyphenol methylase/3-demethylubiquinol 3-O-methyltransferase UbiG [Pseudomonadota bacterium]
TSVDPEEIRRFAAMAEEWWDPAGKFGPLHRMNPVRLTWIRDTICQQTGRDPRAPRPLEGLRILDIGCGGGLVAEPLSRMGAAVTGIDAGEKAVEIARHHAAQTGAQVDYRVTTAEALAAAGETFDVVLALEIVEHVASIPLFMESCAALVRPEGLLFASTINRTARSFLMAIVGAEYILRWLPRGTHSWKKFPRPSELASALRPCGLEVKGITGVVYDPLNRTFSLSQKDLAVNYMLWAQKVKPSGQAGPGSV